MRSIWNDPDPDPDPDPHPDPDPDPDPDLRASAFGLRPQDDIRVIRHTDIPVIRHTLRHSHHYPPPGKIVSVSVDPLWVSVTSLAGLNVYPSPPPVHRAFPPGPVVYGTLGVIDDP